jgi:hypothetical protein
VAPGTTRRRPPRWDPTRRTRGGPVDGRHASFLQASLFTSIVAFGVAAMAMGMGVISVLIGLGIRDVAEKAIAPREAAV